MTTKTLEKRTSELKKEIELLRSVVLGYVGKDSEGDYKPDFVKRAISAVSQNPKYEFKDAGSLLKHLRSK